MVFLACRLFGCLMPSRCEMVGRARDARRVKRPEDAHAKETNETQRDRREWWVEEDLNLRPHAYQACALTT